MRLLFVECGDSRLSGLVSALAGQQKPKPDMISTVNIHMERANIPEFKKMLRDLSPDVMIINPPSAPSDKFLGLVKEVARQTEISSGRCLLVSSVEVLGDAQNRTELAVPLPYSDIGILLLGAENLLLGSTSRSFVLRFPYSTESSLFQSWLSCANPQESLEADIKDKMITLACPDDMAKVILTRLETGWYGLYHPTPADALPISEILNIQDPDRDKRIPDYTLQSRTKWFDMRPSRKVWAEAWDKRYR
jgi:hypothetical protein